jgi:hypothetical protein
MILNSGGSSPARGTRRPALPSDTITSAAETSGLVGSTLCSEVSKYDSATALPRRSDRGRGIDPLAGQVFKTVRGRFSKLLPDQGSSTMMDRGQWPRIAVLTLLLALAGCHGGEDVTTRSLQAARRTWQQAGLRDYDLEWTSSGARTNHYRVFVRGGQVKAVYMVQPDGREVVAKSAEPRLFGVEGLFDTIEEELNQAQAEHPFGQSKGVRVVLRFNPDPKLGYPRDFHRDVLGTQQRLGIDVLRLDTHPPASIPPPRA